MWPGWASLKPQRAYCCPAILVSCCPAKLLPCCLHLWQGDVELQQSLLEQEVASMLQTQDATQAPPPEVAAFRFWEQTDGRLELQGAKVLQETATIRFAVDVLYIGPDTAGSALVSTATTDPNAVGNLADTVAAVTNSTTEIIPVSCSCACLQSCAAAACLPLVLGGLLLACTGFARLVHAACFSTRHDGIPTARLLSALLRVCKQRHPWFDRSVRWSLS